MSGIDPNIGKHEIKTYLDVRLVRKHHRVVNHRKPSAIKAKVEKLLNVGFSYPVPLTE
jgi:hypothetical protein